MEIKIKLGNTVARLEKSGEYRYNFILEDSDSTIVMNLNNSDLIALVESIANALEEKMV